MPPSACNHPRRTRGGWLLKRTWILNLVAIVLLPKLWLPSQQSLQQQMERENRVAYLKAMDISTSTQQVNHAKAVAVRASITTLLPPPPPPLPPSPQSTTCIRVCMLPGSSAGASSAGSAASGKVVCCKCGSHARSARGHALNHCRYSPGCTPDAFIPWEEWHASQQQTATSSALSTMTAQHFVDSEASIVNAALNDMYYEKMAPQTSVDSYKKMLAEHDERCKAELLRRLGEGKTLAQQEELLRTVADIFSVSAHTETRGELEARVEPARAQYRELVDRPDAHGQPQGARRGDHVYDVPICEGLNAIIRDNPSVLQAWQEASEGWACQPGEVTVLTDITDGSVFRNHPELGIHADRSDGALRLGFILYYDEVEVVNAIGQFTGTHKIGLFYWGLINYAPHQRMDLSNIHLATVALDADVSYYGMEQIVSGPPCEPNWPKGSSIGASLRALDAGIMLARPEPDGTPGELLTRGWLVVVSADNPAAAVLCGTMVGSSAVRFCRQCTVDRHEAGYDCPCSFISASSSSTPALRTQVDRLADMETCGNDESAMSAAGWKSWAHAFTRCGPHFDFLISVPEDLMHDEFEGIVKAEAAHFIFYCIRTKGYFTLDDLNHALDTYSWPGGARPMNYFTDSFLVGDTAKKVMEKQVKKAKRDGSKAPAREQGDPSHTPKAGAHVHMTAGQMLTFALHSPQLFLNLNVPADDPAYLVWLDHVKYLNLLMQHSITIEQISEIDRLITKHQNGLKALSKVYPNIWKPKHHYVNHFPLDIYHFGPPRNYWCMRFEALNQVFKKIAVGGSYRDTTRRCAEFWCMRSALARQRRRPWEDWAATRAIRESDMLTVALDQAPEHVKHVFEIWPSVFGDECQFVSTTYVSELKHDGLTIIPGTSWLLNKFDSDGEPQLASLHPLTGIFTVDGVYFLHLLVHDGVKVDGAPLRTAHIPASIEPSYEIVALEEILEMQVLSPANCEESPSGKTWTFVRDV